jgi:PAS domain S-box-containing protein
MTRVAYVDRARDTGSILLFFVLLTFIAIIGQTWWAIVDDRTVTLESEHANGLIAVRLLEEHATQTLRDAERNLDAVISDIQNTAKERTIDGKSIREVISQGQQDNRFLKALQFVNPKGESWVTSVDYPAYQTDEDDRKYLLWMRQHPQHHETVIGHPFQRFYDHQLVTPLARNVYDLKGRYLGILSTDISVSYFSNVYARVAKDSKAIVSLFADDGFVIVRSPFDVKYVDLDISKSPILKVLRNKAAEGSFEDNHFLDEKNSTPRQYTYRKITGFPITTVFARDLDSILLVWRARTADRILYSGVFIAFHLILTYYLMLHIRRLHSTEESLRSSESRFVGLFQRSPVPLALLNLRTDQFIEVNDALLVQSGFTRNEMIGRTPLEVQTWADYADRQPYLELLQKQHFVDRVEVRFRHKHGHFFTCLLSSRLFESNGEQVVLFSPVDVTRQREIENEIRELNIQLEQRVRQRTHNLEEANQELGDALATLKSMQSELLRSEKMAALGSLVAGVAHELNTPIGNSVTVASTLEENVGLMLAEVHSGHPRRSMLSQYLEASAKGSEILVRNLHRAAELMSSFKQVAVDQSSNHRRAFDLKQVLEEIVVTLEPMYKKTPFILQLDLAPDISVESYPGPLGQIMTNFVTNALAHAFEGRTHGVMRLVTRQLDPEHVEITFSDDGVGIQPQHLERVFDPFFTTKLGQGGSGLGMHIVYNLVTSVLGGKITLTSTPGTGSTITLTLPSFAPDGGDGTVT